MPLGNEHLDLLALAEGRLARQEEQEAREHLRECASCRREFADLGETLGLMNKLAREVREAMAGDAKLAAEVGRMFPARGKGLRPEDPDELALEQGDLAPELPAKLAKKVAALKKGSLKDRLSKTVREFTGKSASAAKEWVEDTLSAGPAAVGAPAIRKDATEVEEKEPDGAGEGKTDGQTKEDK